MTREFPVSGSDIKPVYQYTSQPNDTSVLPLTLIWHEAGNDLYHDRFIELGRIFELDVLGPEKFMGMDFRKRQPASKLSLFKSILNGHWLTYIPITPSFYKKILTSRYVYLHEEPHSLIAFIVAITRFGRPFFIESSVINKKGNFSGLNFLELFVYWSATKIIPKNMEVAENLHERGARRVKITSPVGNGVSRSSFHPVDKNVARSVLSRKFPEIEKIVSSGNLVVGYAGRIWEPKGIATICELSSLPNTTILVCGPVEDEYLVQNLRDAGAIVLPKLQKDDLKTFYSALDLFILPSLSTSFWREQFGRVCIEAIYCGTPAIGSAVGGIPMVIGEEQTFSPGSADEATHLIEQYRDLRARAELLEKQDRHVESRFSWEAISRQILDIVQR